MIFHFHFIKEERERARDSFFFFFLFKIRLSNNKIDRKKIYVKPFFFLSSLQMDTLGMWNITLTAYLGGEKRME